MQIPRLTGIMLDEMAKLAYTQMMKAYIEKHPQYCGGQLEILTWEFQSGELKDDWTLLVSMVLREAERLLAIDRRQGSREWLDEQRELRDREDDDAL